VAQSPSPRLNSEALKCLQRYADIILQNHAKGSNTDFIHKLESIDIAYARYRYQLDQNNGIDEDSRSTECGVALNEITVPVVVSQVDSYVGYLADIYLSGYPIFPVVSPPSGRLEAEALQSIIEDHSIRGRYARQFLLNFFDASKYNFTAGEVLWHPLDNFALPEAQDILAGRAQEDTLTPTGFSINRIKRLDPYNTIFDRRVDPIDIPYCGGFAGYIEAITHVELVRRIDYYKRRGTQYHERQVFESQPAVTAADTPFVLGHYTEKPQISTLLQADHLRNARLMDWDAWWAGTANVRKPSRMSSYAGMYEHVTLYVRIIPEAFAMNNVENGKVPQVWRICVVNNKFVVNAERVFSIYDTLPIYFSQPREDGFTLQTQSIAENSIEFQDIASKLMSIRLNSARRAIMDRAIYDSSMINPSHLNSPMPAPKIPLRDSRSLAGKKISDSYYQIPFDSRGTETVMQDAAMVMHFADQINGNNQPQQGQFQKGNKTRKEWDDTMEGARSRKRIFALSMEYQYFIPVKEQIKLNIFTHGVEGVYQNPRSGTSYKIDAAMLERIRQKIQEFKIADGVHPTEKIASTDVLSAGLTMLGNSPFLQQAYGPVMPELFAHLMSLGGVQGIDQYAELAAQKMQGAPQAAQGPVNGPVTTTPAAV
jgi:hypothetical protein